MISHNFFVQQHTKEQQKYCNPSDLSVVHPVEQQKNAKCGRDPEQKILHTDPEIRMTEHRPDNQENVIEHRDDHTKQQTAAAKS